MNKIRLISLFSGYDSQALVCFVRYVRRKAKN